MIQSKMDPLEKILKRTAHPFLGFLPEQKKLTEKTRWYSKYQGVVSNSALELFSALFYGSIINPTITECLR